MKMGDVVMRHLCFRSNKLDPKYEGPFIAIERLPFNKYRLLDPSDDSQKVLHAERLKKVKSELDVGAILERNGLGPGPNDDLTSQNLSPIHPSSPNTNSSLISYNAPPACSLKN